VEQNEKTIDLSYRVFLVNESLMKCRQSLASFVLSESRKVELNLGHGCSDELLKKFQSLVTTKRTTTPKPCRQLLPFARLEANKGLVDISGDTSGVKVACENGINHDDRFCPDEPIVAVAVVVAVAAAAPVIVPSKAE